MPRVNTFIIPMIRPDFIGKCLETLYEYTEKDSFYVYVIDQTNTKEAIDKYEKFSHFWIRPYINLGFSKAVNTGIKLAQTPYVTLLNDDVEFINKKWWQGILDTFDMDPQILAVNPMSPKEGSWGYGYRDDNKETWEPNERFVYEGNDKLSIYPKKPDGTGFFYKEHFDEDDWDFLLNHNPAWMKDSLCDAIPMWCPVFKKEAFKELGLFEEKFFPGGGEDYDMNGRAYSCAWPKPREKCDPNHHRRMVGTTKSWVWHHWGKSKDDYILKNLDVEYLNARERWNDLDELWTEGFDVWGHGHRDENGVSVKYPYKRNPVVHEEEL